MKVSVIIPTLNEADYISRTLDKLFACSRSRKTTEVIVVDSGSRDETVRIVRDYPSVKIYSHPELKGRKYAILNKGADYATGEIFLFLDADTFVPENYDNLIIETIKQGYAGGAFEFKLDRQTPALRFIELVNRIRYRIEQRYYGDQGLFCSAKVFAEAGGYPSKPIMESAALCKALLKKGRLKLVKKNIITSSRRFSGGRLGPLGVLAWDTMIFLLDKCGFSNHKIAKRYWESNDKEF